MQLFNVPFFVRFSTNIFIFRCSIAPFPTFWRRPIHCGVCQENDMLWKKKNRTTVSSRQNVEMSVFAMSGECWRLDLIWLPSFNEVPNIFILLYATLLSFIRYSTFFFFLFLTFFSSFLVTCFPLCFAFSAGGAFFFSLYYLTLVSSAPVLRCRGGGRQWKKNGRRDYTEENSKRWCSAQLLKKPYFADCCTAICSCVCVCVYSCSCSYVAWHTYTHHIAYNGIAV